VGLGAHGGEILVCRRVATERRPRHGARGRGTVALPKNYGGSMLARMREWEGVCSAPQGRSQVSSTSTHGTRLCHVDGDHVEQRCCQEPQGHHACHAHGRPAPSAARCRAASMHVTEDCHPGHPGRALEVACVGVVSPPPLPGHGRDVGRIRALQSETWAGLVIAPLISLLQRRLFLLRDQHMMPPPPPPPIWPFGPVTQPFLLSAVFREHAFRPDTVSTPWTGGCRHGQCMARILRWHRRPSCTQYRRLAHCSNPIVRLAEPASMLLHGCRALKVAWSGPLKWSTVSHALTLFPNVNQTTNLGRVSNNNNNCSANLPPPSTHFP